MSQLLLHTSTGWPYLKDILDILFLPTNYEYRFRYNIRWMCEDLKAVAKLTPLIGSEGVIVHTDIRKIGHDLYEILHFVPIRKVIITDIKHLDEFVWISMKLGDWVKFTENNHNKIRQATPPRYQNYIKSTCYLVDDINFDYIDDTDQESISNWYKMVKLIQTFSAHKSRKSIFLKMLKFVKMGCNNKVLIKPVNGANKNDNTERFFTLSSGTDYKMEILQHYPFDNIDELKIHFNTHSDKIVAFPPYASIHGKYDVLKFLFHTRGDPNTTYTYLNLELDSSDHLISKIPINLKIQGSYAGYILIIAVILIALFLSDGDFSTTSILRKLAASVFLTIATKYVYR